MGKAIWNLVIYGFSIFLVPYYIVLVVNNPKDYWHWFGLVVWVYLLVSTLVDTYVYSALREAKRVADTEEAHNR